MTDTDLNAMLERCEAATEGPWTRASAPNPADGISKAEWMAGCVTDDHGSLMVVTTDNGEGDWWVTAVAGDGPRSGGNADFIAHARTDLPAVIRELQEARRLLEEALKYGRVWELRLWRNEVRAF